MSDVDNNDDNRNDENVDNNDTNEEEEGKIFVGALSWDTTSASLRQHFEKFGEVANVSVMAKQSGQPRGFAFVSMKDPAARDIVLAQDVHTIDGKVVDVKIAVPRSDAPIPSKTDSKKIFVGRLPAEVTEKEFSDYFSRFGPVKDVVIMVDHNNNRSRGFGFVTFENDGCVDAALAQENEIMGKWVDVKRAEPRHLQSNDNRGGRGGGRNMQGRGGYGGRGGYDTGYGSGYDAGGRGGYPNPQRGGYGYGQMQGGGRNMQGGYGGGYGGITIALTNKYIIMTIIIALLSL